MKLLKTKFFYLTISVLSIIIIIFGIYLLRHLVTKNFGIDVKPTHSVDVIETNVFLQNEENWQDDIMGNSNCNMGSYGCTTTSITMVLNKLGYNDTPKITNEKFTNENVYTNDGKIIWKNISSAYDNVDYSYSRTFSGRTLTRLLDNKNLPIVQVKYNHTSIFHWVLIVGATDKEFLIIDPLNKSKEPIELSTHGKVFAYRILKKSM
jgi:hypothetical protein